MKQLLPLTLIAALLGCNNTPVKQPTRLETFLDSFSAKHPEISQNNIKKEQAAEELESVFAKKVDEGVLEDSRLLLRRIDEYGDKYLARFEYPDKKEDNYFLSFELSGVIDKEAVDTLVTGNTYFIEGSGSEQIIKGTTKIETGSSFVSANLGHIQTNINKIVSYRKQKE